MIYFIRDDNFVKIGYASKVDRRFKVISSMSPRVLVLIGSVKGTRFDERKVHGMFKEDVKARILGIV